MAKSSKPAKQSAAQAAAGKSPPTAPPAAAAPMNKRARQAAKKAALATNGDSPATQPAPSQSQPQSQSQSSQSSAKKLKNLEFKQAKYRAKLEAKLAKLSSERSDRAASTSESHSSSSLAASKPKSNAKSASSQPQSRAPKSTAQTANSSGWRRIDFDSDMFETAADMHGEIAGMVMLEEIDGAEFASHAQKYDPNQHYGDSDNSGRAGQVGAKRKRSTAEQSQKRSRMRLIPTLPTSMDSTRIHARTTSGASETVDEPEHTDVIDENKDEDDDAIKEEEVDGAEHAFDETELNDLDEDDEMRAATLAAQKLLGQFIAEAGDEEEDDINDDDDDDDISVKEEASDVDTSEEGDAMVDDGDDDEITFKQEEDDNTVNDADAQSSAKSTFSAALLTTPPPKSQWDEFSLHPLILHALHAVQFSAPTTIQRQCLPASIVQWKDVIAASATGSGKTLAFGIPIIHRLLALGYGLSNDKASDDSSRGVSALILTPTRELALQIVQHLQSITRYTTLRVMGIVGGMSTQKQARLLSSSPDIIVATPGRFHQLMTGEIDTGHFTVSQLQSLKFLVLDEADRMIAQGHFAELTKIIEMIYKQHDKIANSKSRLQHFLFSATLTLDFGGRENVKRIHKKKSKQSISHDDSASAMITRLKSLLRLQSQPHIVDLTAESGRVVSTLRESFSQCLVAEKDYHFYALCVENRDGRIIVFVNAISCLRRLASLMTILQLPVFPLHAEMQQRQRIKNLERFQSSTNGILLCTDVAARGLDIPAVPCVIHYQLPVNAEIYIHRCGRTARAGLSGDSYALISETDSKTWSRILTVCHSGSKDAVTRHDADDRVMTMARRRINLARKIDVILNAKQRQASKSDWFARQAKDMEMLVDEDYTETKAAKSSEDEELDAANKQRVKALDAELARELKAPIADQKRHGKFFTMNIAEELNRRDEQAKSTAPHAITGGKKQQPAKVKHEQ